MEFKTNLYVIMSNDLKSIFLENGMFVDVSELKGREKFKRYYNIGGYLFDKITSSTNRSNIFLDKSTYSNLFTYIPKGTYIHEIKANPATTSSLGVVQPDGTSITISETGIISGQDVKTFTGYSDTGTLVLKSINGVLQWVTE